MKPFTFLLIGCLMLHGCADLIIREQDSIPLATSKVTSRVLAGIATMGISEISIALIKEEEAQAAAEQQSAQNRRSWFNGQLGKLTYAGALAKWGPPSRSQERKGVIVAVWERQSESPGYLVIPPVTPSAYAPTLAAAIPGSGSRLQLVFDRHTELLRSWSVQDW
jgi:hypothetical protein